MKDLILDMIKENKEEYKRFLQEIIQIPTVEGNEEQVAVKIQKCLKKSNINCIFDKCAPGRANLVAFLNDNFDKPSLLYNGHMDIVSADPNDPWEFGDPFSGGLKDNKIYGRGSTDMKSGLAAMMFALKVLKDLNFKTSSNLIFNAVCDEETGKSLGTDRCVKTILKDYNINFSIIGEFTGYNPLPKCIFFAEKGRFQLEITIFGEGGHASMPFTATNPILEVPLLITIIPKIMEHLPDQDPPMSFDQLKRITEPYLVNIDIDKREAFYKGLRALTESTYAITVVRAGEQPNTIPNKCSIIIDFRLLPGHTKEMILSPLKTTIKNVFGFNESRKPYAKLKVKADNQSSIFPDWEISEPVELLSEIVEDVYNKPPVKMMYPATTDAEYLRTSVERQPPLCPQTVLFGPGDISLAHEINEYVEFTDYLNSIKVYTLFAYKFLNK